MKTRIICLLICLFLYMGISCAEMKDEFVLKRYGDNTYLYRISIELVMSGDFLSFGNFGGELVFITTEYGDVLAADDNTNSRGLLISGSGDTLELELEHCSMHRLSDDLSIMAYSISDPSYEWPHVKYHTVIYYEGKLYDCQYFVQNLNKGWSYRDGGPIRVLSNVKDEHFRYIDRHGKVINQVFYHEGGLFSEGLAAVRDSEGVCGFIDETGAFVIKPDMENWVDIYNIEYKYFCNNRAPVVGANGKQGYIDRTGTLVIDAQYVNAGIFSEGRARVYNEAGNVLYIDTDGKRISELEFDGGREFSNGYAIVDAYAEGKSSKFDKVYGCIDINGNITVPLEHYNFTTPNPQGTAMTYTDIEANRGYSAMRIVDLATGEFLTDNVWEIEQYNTYAFNNPWGVYVVYKDMKAGVIDARGNILFPAIYDRIIITDNGNLIIYLDGRKFCVMIP